MEQKKHLMFKLFLLTYSLFFSVQASATCDFTNIENYIEKSINDISSFKDLVPENCLESFFEEETCECANSNINKFNPTIDIVDKDRNRLFLQPIKEKMDMALLGIANDIVAISSDSEIDSNEIGKQCSITNLDQFKCESYNGFFDERTLKSSLKSISQTFSNEMKSRFEKNQVQPNLIHREEYPNKCGNEIPDNFSAQVKSKVSKNLLSALLKNQTIKKQLSNSKNIDEAMYAAFQNDIDSQKYYEEIISNPELEEALKNPENLQLALDGKPLKFNKDKIKADIISRCKSLDKEMHNLYCNENKNSIPDDFETLTNQLSTIQKDDNLSDYLSSSVALKYKCDGDRSSDFKSLYDGFNNILPASFRNESLFKKAKTVNYENSILTAENNFCEMFSNDKSVLKSMDQSIEACNQEKTQGGFQSPKCMYIIAASELLKPYRVKEVLAAEDKATEELDKKVKDGSLKLNSKEYFDAFKSIVTSLKENISVDDLLSPFSQKPKLVQKYLGVPDNKLEMTIAESPVDNRTPLTGLSSSAVIPSSVNSSNLSAALSRRDGSTANASNARSGQIYEEESVTNRAVQTYGQAMNQNMNRYYEDNQNQINQAQTTMSDKDFQNEISRALIPPPSNIKSKASNLLASNNNPKSVLNPMTNNYEFVNKNIYNPAETTNSISTQNIASIAEDESATIDDSINNAYGTGSYASAVNQKIAASSAAKSFPSAGGGSIPGRSLGSASQALDLVAKPEVLLNQNEILDNKFTEDNSGQIRAFLQGGNVLKFQFKKDEDKDSLVNNSYVVEIIKNSNGSFRFVHTENELDPRFMKFFNHLKSSFSGNNLPKLLRELNIETVESKDGSSAPTNSRALNRMFN